MSDITDEELEKLKKWASVYHTFFPQRDILRLIDALKDAQEEIKRLTELVEDYRVNPA